MTNSPGPPEAVARKLTAFQVRYLFDLVATGPKLWSAVPLMPLFRLGLVQWGQGFGVEATEQGRIVAALLSAPAQPEEPSDAP